VRDARGLAESKDPSCTPSASAAARHSHAALESSQNSLQRSVRMWKCRGHSTTKVHALRERTFSARDDIDFDSDERGASFPDSDLLRARLQTRKPRNCRHHHAGKKLHGCDVVLIERVRHRGQHFEHA